MAIFELVNPVSLPLEVSEQRVLKSEEVVPSSDVAVLPVAGVKVHIARGVKVHVVVVEVAPVEVESVCICFTEIEVVEVAPCEVHESIEVVLVKVSVREAAFGKVHVVEVTIVSVFTIEGAVVEVGGKPLNSTETMSAELEEIEPAVVEFH